MKINKTTPGYNLLWEGSRMMLPEHREALLQKQLESKKKSRPDLDPHQLENIQYILAESMEEKSEITLVLYHPYGSSEINGYVVRADHIARRILFQTDDGDKWIPLSDILDAKR